MDAADYSDDHSILTFQQHLARTYFQQNVSHGYNLEYHTTEVLHIKQDTGYSI